VVVTGASSGLGERFARVLSAEGIQVVAAARREERLRRLEDDCGPLIKGFACDLADEAQLSAAWDRLRASLPHQSVPACTREVDNVNRRDMTSRGMSVVTASHSSVTHVTAGQDGRRTPVQSLNRNACGIDPLGGCYY
jgi:NAD(P)-dependent dehydrogenase (short-subunit alcohol dehydrogenase family)